MIYSSVVTETWIIRVFLFADVNLKNILEVKDTTIFDKITNNFSNISFKHV